MKKRLIYLLSFLLLLNPVLYGCGGSSDDTDIRVGNGNGTGNDQTTTFTGEAAAHADTSTDGEATIYSETLGVRYDLRVVDQNGNALPDIEIDYFEIANNSYIVIADPLGQHTSAIVYSPPNDMANLSVSGYTDSGVKLQVVEPDFQPNDVFTTISLIFTIADITLTELEFIESTYEVLTFYISDFVLEGEGWLMYCEDWDRIGDMIAAKTKGVPNLTGILISLVSVSGSESVVEFTADRMNDSASDWVDNLLEIAIHRWGRTINELYEKMVAIQVFPVDESSFATGLRNMYIPYKIYEDHPICEQGAGDIVGTVVSAVDGTPISNAQITVTDGITLTTQTTDGKYSFADIPAGDYIIRASATGYVTSEKSITIAFNVSQTVNFALSPELNSGQYRIVLEWGQYPRDLDSHMWTPSFYHIYFRDRGSQDSPPYARLDLDDTDGYGPEPITIYASDNGEYKYSVYNYLESPDIKKSGANVKLYGDQGLILQWTIPNTGTGLWWNVLTLNPVTGQVTSINQISDSHQ